MPKHTPLGLRKYNIDQLLLHELSNLESRTILFSIVNQSKLPFQISYENKIPPSTVYKKLCILKSLGLIRVEKIELINRQKSKFYRSNISEAEICVKKFELIVQLMKNNIIAEK